MSKSLDLAGYELTEIVEALARKLLANAADELKRMKKDTPEAFEGCDELTADDARCYADTFLSTIREDIVSDLEAALKTQPVTL